MAQEDGPPKRPHKGFTDEFRRSLVDHLLTSGKSIAQIAREFGISSGNLRQWKLRYGAAAKPVDSAEPKTPEELVRENERLRKELARVTLQKDILKKTISIVLEQSNRDIP